MLTQAILHCQTQTKDWGIITWNIWIEQRKDFPRKLTCHYFGLPSTIYSIDDTIRPTPKKSTIVINRYLGCCQKPSFSRSVPTTCIQSIWTWNCGNQHTESTLLSPLRHGVWPWMHQQHEVKTTALIQFNYFWHPRSLLLCHMYM
jgi:hypothetical protein